MLDAIFLPVRPDGPKEGVLVAWGFTTDGDRVLLDVCLGQRERTEDWTDLGRGLIARGLRSPLLVVSDGAPGLIRAITELWPDADRGRCTVHRLRNVLAKLPKRPGAPCEGPRGVLGGARCRHEPGRGRGRACGSSSVSSARDFPSAAACLADDLPALTVHLRYPLRLRKRLRSTNLLERSLEEVRRRTKVIGRFPGETSCLTMAWAVMDLVIAGARGLGLTLPDRHAIAGLVAARSVPADGGADRLTYPCRGACAVSAFPADPGRDHYPPTEPHAPAGDDLERLADAFERSPKAVHALWDDARSAVLNNQTAASMQLLGYLRRRGWLG